MKLERAATALPAHGWQLLPLRFHRIDADSVVLTNLVGEHVFVTPDELSAVVEGTCADQELLARLRAAHLIQVPGETLPAELLAIKLRTRMRRLPDSTGLHIFVVTLRCEHTCRYCQVSRQSAAKNEFDMTEETARRALELAFRSPSPQLKIEFQGGEPLLNFPLVRWITGEANRMNKMHGKDLAFVIATNLALLDDEVLGFCAEEQIHISTSLDGPQDLHNGNRRRPGGDSSGYGLYLMAGCEARMRLGMAGAPSPGVSEMPGPVLRLGPELAHLDAGDIIHVPEDGRRVTVLWKNSARHNGLLLTEQCDNYCLMCSQPPKDREDSWLFDRARKVISLLPEGARALSLTGGEPTLHADALIGLLEHCKRVAPGLSVHLLSNGRRFADPAELAASVGRPRRLPARACRGGRHTRNSRNHDADLQPPALRPGPTPVAVRGSLNQ